MQTSLMKYWECLDHSDQLLFGQQLLSLRLDDFKTSCLFTIMFHGEGDYRWIENDFAKSLEQFQPSRILTFVRSAFTNRSGQGLLKSLLNVLSEQASSKFELKHFNAWDYLCEF